MPGIQVAHMHRPLPLDARRPARRTRPGIGPWLLAVGLVLSLSCVPSSPDQDESPTGPEPGPTTRTVTIAWDAPTRDARGDPLEDLAGYRIYYDRSAPLDRDEASVVEVGDGLRHTFEGLAPGVWHFAVTAFDEAGNESELSDELQADLR